MDKRIVYEISQLAKWPGMVTGIPRVMDELAQRFASDDAVFIDWDPVGKVFYEVSYEQATRKREDISKKNSVISVESVSFMKKAVCALKGRSRKFATLIERAKERKRRFDKTESLKEFTFRKDDLLLITWGEAIDSDYTDAIVKAHSSGTSLAQVIHDIIPIVTPQYAGHTTEGLINYLSKICPIASYIISVSKSTQHDIKSWLDDEKITCSAKLEVMRLGDDFKFSHSTPVHDANFIESGLKGMDYLITVGTIEARKNHTLYYYTYKLAAQNNVKLPKLIIVGRRGWQTDEIYNLMTQDPDVKDQFVFLHNVSDAELSWLYEHSLLSLYVSFYEGWGLPVAESIARGVPCITSNTSSMPEVAQGLASYYISPYSPNECLSAIGTLLIDDKIEEERKKIKSYKQFSWNESYQQIRKIMDI